MSRQAAVLVALASIAAAGAVLSVGAWVLLWRQWRARRTGHVPAITGSDLTGAPGSSRNEATRAEGDR